MTELAATPSSAASEFIRHRRLVRRWIAILIFFGLLWRLVRFGLAESPGELSKTRNAWVITCAAAYERLGASLAQQANMEWTMWSKEDLQIGPKYPPLTLAVAHLTQKTAVDPRQPD